jgi:hypothetical protein
VAQPLNEAEVQLEARLIRAEEGWPLWPVLPMKNIHRYDDGYPQDQTHGVMVSPEFTKVWIINLFELKSGLIKPQLVGRTCLEFESIEALIEAGWVGD